MTDARLRDPPASDWLMWRRTYNGGGYSPLDQIDKDQREEPAGRLDLVDGFRRHREPQKLAKKFDLLLAEPCDFDEVLRARQHCRQAQQEDLLKRRDDLAGLPRVRQSRLGEPPELVAGQTAKALGLTVPPNLIALADEVID